MLQCDIGLPKRDGTSRVAPSDMRQTHALFINSKEMTERQGTGLPRGWEHACAAAQQIVLAGENVGG
jgi:hypothetical protein